MKSVEYTNSIKRIGDQIKILVIRVNGCPSKDDLVKLAAFDNIDKLTVREKNDLINHIRMLAERYSINDCYYNLQYNLKDDDIEAINCYIDHVMSLVYICSKNHRFLTDYFGYEDIICYMQNKLLCGSEHILFDKRILRCIKNRARAFTCNEEIVSKNEREIISFLIDNYKNEKDVSKVNEIVTKLRDIRTSLNRGKSL